jgi:hypothetical protein
MKTAPGEISEGRLYRLPLAAASALAEIVPLDDGQHFFANR